MIIAGAGLAGLIAGHIFRNHKPTIVERANGIPRNHAALLRFRSSDVGEATNIKFKKVFVRKQIVVNGQFLDAPNVFLANMYSRKVTGKILDRSIWKLEPETRYVAPQDFSEQMAASLNIQTGQDAWKWYLDRHDTNEPFISTMPMPVLMELVGWKDKPKFDYLPIWAVNCDISLPVIRVDQTIYYPGADEPYYRATLAGQRLTVEFIKDVDIEQAQPHIESVMGDFGLVPFSVTTMTVKEQKYGKISPIDDSVRKEFIYTMTREYGIYSLGRFATWKQILLDDVVKDCEVINSLLGSEAKAIGYRQSLHNLKGKVDA